MKRPPQSVRSRRSGEFLRSVRILAVVLAALLLCAGNLQAAVRSLFFPHLITGMGFETRLLLTNPSNGGAQVTLTARSDDGALIAGSGVRNPMVVSLGPHQQVSLQAGELFGLLPNTLRDRKSTRLNSSHIQKSRMPSSA